MNPVKDVDGSICLGCSRSLTYGRGGRSISASRSFRPEILCFRRGGQNYIYPDSVESRQIAGKACGIGSDGF